MRCYPASEWAPLVGVVPVAWRDIVLECDAQGRPRVNRVACETCVLQALREQLRCKEVWIEGADRYRNPDLPADFDARRDEHYDALGLPRDARVFVEQTRTEARTRRRQGHTSTGSAATNSTSASRPRPCLLNCQLG